MGLFGGSKPKLEFIPYTSRLPRENRAQGKRIVQGNLDFFENLMGEGETPLERSLFMGSRADTLRRYGQATKGASQQLRQLGAGSSTASDERYRDLAQNLLSMLTQQDAMRAASLLRKRQEASQIGFGNVMGLADSTQIIEKPGEPGLLGGLISPLLGAAGQQFGGAAGKWLGGIFK